jgi:hypothetical protein
MTTLEVESVRGSKRTRMRNRAITENKKTGGHAYGEKPTGFKDDLSFQ